MLSEEDRAYIESLVPDLNLDEINELCTIINHQKNNYFSGKISLLNKLKSEKRRILEEMASIKAELEAEANKLKLAGNIRQSREYYEIINEPNLGMQMNSCADLVHEDPFLKDLHIGDTVAFGQFPQGIEKKSIAAILWFVLDVDENYALLLSKYCIECKPFNNEKKPVLWKDSSLFAWLNNRFINSFSNKEQSLLVSDNGELISILSYEEISRYLKTDTARTCYGTLHALKTANHFIDSTTVSYWLKDDIADPMHSSIITPLGHFNNNSAVNDSTISIRPVVKVRFK